MIEILSMIECGPKLLTKFCAMATWSFPRLTMPCSMPAVKSICQHQHPKPLDLQWSICIAVLSANTTVSPKWALPWRHPVEQAEQFITNYSLSEINPSKCNDCITSLIYRKSRSKWTHMDDDHLRQSSFRHSTQGSEDSPPQVWRFHFSKNSIYFPGQNLTNTNLWEAHPWWPGVHPPPVESRWRAPCPTTASTTPPEWRDKGNSARTMPSSKAKLLPGRVPIPKEDVLYMQLQICKYL